MTHVALIGLGRMGAPMARRLLDAGLRLTVWNRTPDKAAPAVARGATLAVSAAAAGQADIVITMLENGAVVDELVTQHLSPSLRPGAMLIDMSSIPPDLARTHAAALAARGVGYLDAPVSGGTKGAADGTLTILAGGQAPDFERARVAFAPLGTPHHVGAHGAGQTAKLVNQAIVAVTIGAVAEGLHLARRCGLDAGVLRHALAGGFADSRILREHGRRMVESDFTPGAANTIFLKDLNTIAAVSADVGVRLPLVEEITDAYRQLVAGGHAQDDHASYILTLEQTPPHANKKS